MAGGTFNGEDGLIVMAEMEWYQTHQTPGYHVFEAITVTPFIIMSRPPLTSLHWSRPMTPSPNPKKGIN